MEDAVQDSTRRQPARVQEKEMTLSSHTRQDTGQADQYSPGHSSGAKVSVYEAANALGVTVDAIRKRIQRGTISHQRDEAGRVWVLLDAASSRQNAANSTIPYDGEHAYLLKDRDELVDSLKDQVEYLRQVIETRDLELQRKDSIIAALTQRLPELEPAAPPEASESPLTAPEAPGKGGNNKYSPREKAEEHLSWWRRLLGG